MYNGIGLQTPRGSGTNGYIQGNKFFLKPRTNISSNNHNNYADGVDLTTIGGVKRANKDILEHDRKRDVELKLLILHETLADQGYTDSEISHQLEQTRHDLLRDDAPHRDPASSSSAKPTRFSNTQTHQVAARKEKQLETMRAALGIKHSDDPSEHEVQEPKQEAEAHSPDNEESDRENYQYQKQDAKHHGNLVSEEKESLKKGIQTVDGKAVKDPKKEELERKKDDVRGFKRAHDKENEKGKYGYSSDSDASGSYEGGVKKCPDHFDKSSKKTINDVSNKLRRSSKHLETESSDSDGYSGKGNARKHDQKHVKKQKRFNTDSDSDLDKKQFGKQRGKNQRSDSDNSDSGGDYRKENARKHAQKPFKKQKRLVTDSDSDLDKKQFGKQRGQNRRSDSDHSDSDGDYRKENASKHAQKHIKKQKKVDADSDSGFNKNQGGKRQSNNRRPDSDNSDSGGDYRKENERKTTIEWKKHSRRHVSSDSDNGKKYAIENRTRDRNGRKHDSEYDQAEANDGRRNLSRGMEKINKPSRGQERDETGKSDVRHEKDSSKDVPHGKGHPEVTKRRNNMHNIDDERTDSEGGRKRTVKLKGHVSSDSDNGKKYAIENRTRDRNGRKHDSEYDQAEANDERRNLSRGMEKINKPSRRHERDETVKSDVRREKDSNKDVPHGKGHPEVTKRRNNLHTIDDERSDSEGGRKRTVKLKGHLSGRKQQQGPKKKLNSDDSGSSDSRYGTDTDSEDSGSYNQARHGKRKDVMDSKDGGNDNISKKHRYASEEGFSYKTDRRHDVGKDRITNQNTDEAGSKGFRRRDVQERLADIRDSKTKTAGLKEERGKERDIQGHASHSRNLEDQRTEGNRVKQIVKKNPSDDNIGSKKSHTENNRGHDDSMKRRHAEYEQGHDDRKKRRYGSPEQHRGRDSYEHKYGEDSGRHGRRH